MAQQIKILSLTLFGFLKWLSKLGTKEGRTDLWVICITFAFITCITGYIPCMNNSLVMTILVGMFADLGVKELITFKQDILNGGFKNTGQ
jgi:hypothetical protein